MSRHRNPWLKLLRKVQLCGSRNASRSRIKAVTITEDDLHKQWNKQDGKCYWLNIPMNIDDVYTTNNPFAPSVDRLHNDKDYHADNIVICTMFANLGRGRLDEQSFTLFVKYLKDHIND